MVILVDKHRVSLAREIASMDALWCSLRHLLKESNAIAWLLRELTKTGATRSS
jgi:hypothetical protein